MGRTCDLIAVYFSDEARALNRGLHVVGQTDILLEAQGRLLDCEIIVNPILECDPNEGEAIERGRANDIHSRRWRESHLDRNCVITLHLLGRLPRSLRRNFENHRRGIGICLDIEF
jgi:hypothetical protein